MVHSFLILAMFAFACKKEKTSDPVVSDPPVGPQNPLPSCENLPNPPAPFGWKDSTRNEDENVNFFRSNPSLSGNYIYCINGKVFPQNRLYLYNYVNNERLYVGANGDYIPQAHTNGWMLFNQQDHNIYKIKLNGDSLTQITGNNLCSDPKWDYTGQFIFCYQAANGIALSYLLKLKPNGQVVASIPLDYPNSVPSKSSNRIYYLKAQNNKLSIYLWDLTANTETLVLNSSKVLNGAQNDFFDLNIDNKEDFLYWTNSSGVLKYDLKTKTMDTLLKNCPNYTFLNPIVSENSEELTFSCEVLKPLSTLVLFREYRTFELNLRTRQWRELKLFP